MFDKFGDYMFYLLPGPMRKLWSGTNQMKIFFKVIGKHFDEAKEALEQVREESMIITASEIMLIEFGKERKMPRLQGEKLEDYRIRLMLKNAISEMAGTSEGIVLALEYLGYNNAKIEPFYLYEPDRWAEFVVYLPTQFHGGVKDIVTINNVVSEVKSASSRPIYGSMAQSKVIISSKVKLNNINYPICNVLISGAYPEQEAMGRSFNCKVGVIKKWKGLENNRYRCNTFNAGEELK